MDVIEDKTIGTAEGAIAPSAVAVLETEPSGVVPANLPVSTEFPDYMQGHETEADFISSSWEDEYIVKNLEDHAHRERVLLSSDALRYLIRGIKDENKAIEHLDRIIRKAKAVYPSEDGWLALNLSRLEELDKSPDWPTAMETPVLTKTLPVGSGSVAEAILSGNLAGALHLVENRPMVALADATADLDAIYRLRTGMPVGKHQISELLKQEAEKLTLEQLADIISALTSAIDGTYNDEKAAVKTAIIKAVKIVA